MLNIRIARSMALSLLACSALASAATPQLALHQDAKLGSILTANDGMTLYLFTKDAPGVSNCADKCAATWPPLLSGALPTLPDGVAGKLSLIKRKDGGEQVAYNGWPLYFWVNDKKAGDTTGQDVGKVWFAVNPSPVVSTSKAGDLGEHLVDASGMTLYLFTKDALGVSNCTDKCAAAWLPLLSAYLSESKDSKLGTAKRKDGALQVTYAGQPLYHWANDKKPGDMTGQNVGKVWFVVKP